MTMTWIGPFCAFMSSVTWALGSTGYSKIAREHSAFAVNLARSSIALPLFFLAAVLSAAIQTGDWHSGLRAFDVVEARHLGWLALSMFASYGLGDSIFLISSRTIGIPAALTIASSYPLLTASWGAFVEHQWLTLSQTIGLLIAVGGIAVVILSAPRMEKDESVAEKIGLKKYVGVLFAFGASICWAINSYSVTRGGQGIPAPVGNTIRMGVALILCAVIGKVVFPKSKAVLPFQMYRKWLWLFVIEAFGGSYFYLYGLSHSPLAVGATLASLAPVISVPVALALRLETFSWKRTAGVITVVSGLFLLVGGLNS